MHLIWWFEMALRGLGSANSLLQLKTYGGRPSSQQLFHHHLQKLASGHLTNKVEQWHPQEALPRTPSPVGSNLFSWSFRTPQTQRHFNTASRYVKDSVKRSSEGFNALQQFEHHVDGLVNGAVALSVEFEQLKEQLAKLEANQIKAKSQQNERRRYLQRGGALQVSTAREMIRTREEKEEERQTEGRRAPRAPTAPASRKRRKRKYK